MLKDTPWTWEIAFLERWGNNLVSDFNWNGFIVVIFGIIATDFSKWYLILIVPKSLFYAVL